MAGQTAGVSSPLDSPRAQTAIRVRNLRKLYGDLEAVRGIDFDVERGEIFGLIGPDGAGKTSTFQILAGVMNATAGNVDVFGKSARDARLETGYLTQAFSLYPDLTVMENIRFVGDLRLAPPGEITQRGLHYLDLFGMRPFVNRLAAQLSGGMKQKLALACALVPQPKVLLLDEPTTGVDPVSRREFWDAITRLAIDGLTILVATPYLDEAERCNRVALMHLGEIKDLQTPGGLRKSLHAKRLEVRPSDLRAAQTALRAIEKDVGIVDVQRFGDHFDVLARDDRADEVKRAVETGLRAAGLKVAEIRADEPTLENVFVASLRASGQDTVESAFPARSDHLGLRGKIAIGATNLRKHFGSFVAVDGVNLDVRYGEIYGLLGANGAGKTTTIKMLCGLLDPSGGVVQLAGAKGGHRRDVNVRQQVGYMSQKFSLYDDLAIDENLDFFAGVYGVPKAERAEKIAWVLEFSGLPGKEKEVTGRLPGGWKQRVAFGSSIMHEPSVLFLDEPTSGVDPIARRAFWRVIVGLADAGAAVLVTTHYLEEAEQCNRLGFMAAGKLVLEGSPSEIKAREPGHLLEFRTDKPLRAADLLQAQGERWRVSVFGDRVHVVVDDVAAGLQSTTQRLQSDGVAVLDAREIPFSLEDVFIQAVERVRAPQEVA
ncbi:MAG: ATP-binding cassette domain-containing protein [Candidatus Tumulicola sp.]